jgi:hypothetical protein
MCDVGDVVVELLNDGPVTVGSLLMCDVGDVVMWVTWSSALISQRADSPSKVQGTVDEKN